MLRLCISHHARPVVPAQLYDELILTPGLPHYDVLAGSAAVPAIIERCTGNATVALMTHRRVVVRWPPNLDRESTTTPQGLLAMPAEDFTPFLDLEFLAGVPVNCPNGIDAHFERAHPGMGIQNLRSYVRLALDMGLLTDDEVVPFVKSSTLIPGGVQLGVYPAPVLRDILERANALNQEYAKRFRERVIGTRTISFMSERFESYLLGKELKRRYLTGLPREVFGLWLLVNQFAVR
jgi:hypothetical protein